MEYDDPVAFTALLDANVLHPPGLRDLLVRLGQTGLFRPRWSERILDEMVRSILRRRPDLDANRLTRTRQLMREAVPDCLVTGYEALIAGLTLPDPEDRHVRSARFPVRSLTRVEATKGHVAPADAPGHGAAATPTWGCRQHPKRNT